MGTDLVTDEYFIYIVIDFATKFKLWWWNVRRGRGTGVPNLKVALSDIVEVLSVKARIIAIDIFKWGVEKLLVIIDIYAGCNIIRLLGKKDIEVNFMNSVY